MRLEAGRQGTVQWQCVGGEEKRREGGQEGRRRRGCWEGGNRILVACRWCGKEEAGRWGTLSALIASQT